MGGRERRDARVIENVDEERREHRTFSAKGGCNLRRCVIALGAAAAAAIIRVKNRGNKFLVFDYQWGEGRIVSPIFLIRHARAN